MFQMQKLFLLWNWKFFPLETLTVSPLWPWLKRTIRTSVRSDATPLESQASPYPYLHPAVTYFSIPSVHKFYNFTELQAVQHGIKLDLAIMLDCSKLHQSQNVDSIPFNIFSVALLSGSVMLTEDHFWGDSFNSLKTDITLKKVPPNLSLFSLSPIYTDTSEVIRRSLIKTGDVSPYCSRMGECRKTLLAALF